MKYTCPCCGYKTLPEGPSDTHYICKICWWQDDGVQFYKPDFEGGANKVSLKQAQKNFIKFGASEERFIKNARKPNEKDIKDLNWKPFI
ncbi:CPCC family cysteine-rich protein [Metabacillus fastidiosus]|uniref:CPCC family cysteine-rich protein n=1 Tax=Metabacillus fastidiosus TaxID=1458 RepID=UPI003D2BEF6F